LGENDAVGECDRFVSAVIIDGVGLKNVDKKVYSAVVLSMKTRNRDLNRASTGSF
jgi:hypothetical protein